MKKLLLAGLLAITFQLEASHFMGGIIQVADLMLKYLKIYKINNNQFS